MLDNFNYRCVDMCNCMILRRNCYNTNFEINRFKHIGVLFDSIYIICGLDSLKTIKESENFKEIIKENDLLESNELPIVNFSQDVKYVGNILQGKFNGEGTLYIRGKKYYEGEFKDNLFHGVGKIYSMYCDIYEGQFVNGEVNGFGKVKWCNGNSYQGNFTRNMINGHGLYTFNNNSFYEGSFVFGKRNGFGNLSLMLNNLLSFNIKSEDWFQNYILGKAIITDLITGLEFRGEIKCFTNLLSPQRTYFLPHGKGVLTNKDGIDFFVGSFSYGTREGRGNEYFTNGFKKFSGMFENGFYEGEGTLYNSSNQIIYKGDFHLNEKHGEGWLFTDENPEYVNFKNDKKFGKAISTNSSLETSVKYYCGEKIVSKKISDFKEDEQQELLKDCCPICQENYKKDDLITKLDKCDHRYHSECLFTWLKEEDTCPMCRSTNLFEESENKKRKLDF